MPKKNKHRLSTKDVCELLEINESVFYYWKKILPHISDEKEDGRYYTNEDVANLKKIKCFLYDNAHTMKSLKKNYPISINNNYNNKEEPFLFSKMSENAGLEPYNTLENITLGEAEKMTAEECIFSLEQILFDLMSCKRLLDDNRRN